MRTTSQKAAYIEVVAEEGEVTPARHRGGPLLAWKDLEGQETRPLLMLPLITPDHPSNEIQTIRRCCFEGMTLLRRFFWLIGEYLMSVHGVRSFFVGQSPINMHLLQVRKLS